MRGFWQDLRYGTRMLASNRGFTIVAVLTLALGIGANTAIFSVLDPLLLRKLPVANPDQLVTLSASGPVETLGSLENDFYKMCRDGSHSLAGVVWFSGAERAEVQSGGANHTTINEVVSPNFFSVLGVRAARGRLFVPEDALSGSTNIVISFDYWK